MSSQSSPLLSSVFNNTKTPQSQAQLSSSVTSTTPNRSIVTTSASANVALSSPLLVNLLQNDATGHHLKTLSSHSGQFISQNDTTTQKRKRQGKPRKSKDKSQDELDNNSNETVTSSSQPYLLPVQSSISISLNTSQTISPLTVPSNNSFSQHQGVETAPAMQQHMITIPISATSRYY